MYYNLRWVKWIKNLLAQRESSYCVGLKDVNSSDFFFCDGYNIIMKNLNINYRLIATKNPERS